MLCTHPRLTAHLSEYKNTKRRYLAYIRVALHSIENTKTPCETGLNQTKDMETAFNVSTNAVLYIQKYLNQTFKLRGKVQHTLVC